LPRRGAAGRTHAGAVFGVVLVGAALLLLGAGWDLSIGAHPMSAQQILSGLVGHPDSLNHQILWNIRMPRVALAALVGCTMAISGVLMQGVAANPLAAPDIVGVSAGAALVAVAGSTVFARVNGTELVLLSIGGAAAAAFAVMGVASAGQGRTSPIRLALAGVTVTAMLMSMTQALLLLHQNGTAGIFVWLVGGVNSAQWSDITTIGPWIAVGLVGALLLAVPLNILAMGEDSARGVGLNVNRTRTLGVLCVVCLAGAAVAVAGPVAFIGLIVPHITRQLVGVNHAVVIPVAGLLGAALLMLADVLCRYIQYPFETPTGIVTAVLGAPFFIYLARHQKVSA
jgi:iron complex transport system permease protein